ncbi:hypothetical protein MB901379_01938 [Mycobacterium basiliense]|uniref:Uncharacterized protein n=1 Tax=Mycobacterium basiliense TaxID=2094119 RepID=A0A447GD27_9MYCO|nr:hypothetical protein MB901379_01938 [Mycobacterium basiliense]
MLGKRECIRDIEVRTAGVCQPGPALAKRSADMCIVQGLSTLVEGVLPLGWHIAGPHYCATNAPRDTVSAASAAGIGVSGY